MAKKLAEQEAQAKADFQRESGDAFLPWYKHYLDKARALQAFRALYDDPESHPKPPISSPSIN